MSWQSTTHDWTSTVDADHLADIRRRCAALTPGGALHLLLEVVAYAADEAAALGSGTCRVTLRADGSATVADHGRGTDTRLDARGGPVKKPVMSTKDLRFFDHPEPPLLPDGNPRRGMSVVAALSRRLEHCNRRAGGSWTQEYANGVPTSGLRPVTGDGTTGTTVSFLPDDMVQPSLGSLHHDALTLLTDWPALSVQLFDERGRP